MEEIMFLTLYKPVKAKDKVIKFRSILKCGFAIRLDIDNKVKYWEYRKSRVKYINSFTGNVKLYVCPFYVEYKDGTFENIEVTREQYPLDKYLYAENQMDNWRFATKKEMDESEDLFYGGINKRFVEFKNIPANQGLFLFMSKTEEINLPDYYDIIDINKAGEYYEILIKNNNYVSRNKKSHSIDEIIELAKKMNLKNISKQLKADPKAIANIIENNGYYVRWTKDKRIYKDGKLIWRRASYQN